MENQLSLKEMIERGYLVRPKVYVPQAKPPKPENYMPDTISMYLKYCSPNNGAFVYCTSIHHAEELSAAFNDLGTTAEALHSKLTPRKRKALIDRFLSGETKVICGASLIIEVEALPKIRCTIHLAKTNILSVWLQQTAIPLRAIYAPGFDLDTADGRLAAIAASDKPDAIILDMVGNTFNLGMPGDTHPASALKEHNITGLIFDKK